MDNHLNKLTWQRKVKLSFGKVIPSAGIPIKRRLNEQSIQPTINMLLHLGCDWIIMLNFFIIANQ